MYQTLLGRAVLSSTVLGVLGLSWALTGVLVSAPASALTDDEIRSYQEGLSDKPLGQRIAAWAEKMVGTPYDPDPLGDYVTRSLIVADRRVDCMYLTFRAVELAMSSTPEDAVTVALQMRFHGQGRIEGGSVVNYDERFRYGEDMIRSGKWGKEITTDLGPTRTIRGARDMPKVVMVDRQVLLKGIGALRTGDIVFFIKAPEERLTDEIVGHMGIIKREPCNYQPNSDKVFLLHAKGLKGKGGVVEKTGLREYILRMPFLGAKVTRFD